MLDKLNESNNSFPPRNTMHLASMQWHAYTNSIMDTHTMTCTHKLKKLNQATIEMMKKLCHVSKNQN